MESDSHFTSRVVLFNEFLKVFGITYLVNFDQEDLEKIYHLYF